MSILSLNTATPTKLRAMQAKLLKKEELIYLSNSESVNEVIHKIDELKPYHLLFKDLNLDKLHRQDLERVLYVKLLMDYSKLFSFVDGTYKKFLKLYFIHFEIRMLKRILRDVLDQKNVSYVDDIFKAYFDKYSKINFEKLSETTDAHSFIEALYGSIYYEPLSKLKDTATLFDYELCLDLVYFKSLWKNKDKFLPKKEAKQLDVIIGTRIDLLNMEWIYRSKMYYKLDNTTIYSILIPIYYKLNTQALKALVEANNIDEFKLAFNESYYGREKKKHFNSIDKLEDFNDKFLYYTFLKNVKTHPNSVVLLYSYLFKRELEIELLIHIIESVKYKIPNYDIVSALTL